jgi:hypothetical protein
MNTVMNLRVGHRIGIEAVATRKIPAPAGNQTRSSSANMLTELPRKSGMHYPDIFCKAVAITLGYCNLGAQITLRETRNEIKAWLENFVINLRIECTLDDNVRVVQKCVLGV